MGDGDNPGTVNLFGTDIPKENISARIEQGFIKIEFKLPDDLDPEAPKSTVEPKKETIKRLGRLPHPVLSCGTANISVMAGIYAGT
jgi:hypothetical protein